MQGFMNMLRDGGWGAYLALFVGVLGVLVGVAALVTMIFSRRAAAWVGVAAMVFAIVAPGVGLLGMASGRHKTEAAVGMIDSSATRERILKMGYRESQNAAKVGFGAALLPLALGLVAAMVGAAGNRRVVAGAVAVAAIVPTAGAFLAGRAPLPKGRYDLDPEDDVSWDLVAARERVDVTPARGCDDFDKALEPFWAPVDRDQWPRSFAREPAPLVADWRATANRCAELFFDDVASHRPATTWSARKLLESPLLEDDELHADVFEYALSHGAGTGTGGQGFLGHGRLGPAPKRPASDEPRIIGGGISAEAVRSVVRASSGAMHACYEKGLARNPALHGRVEIDFRIDKDGKVSDPSGYGSELPDQRVVLCVERAFRGLVFPAPKDEDAHVRYPIDF